MRLLRAGQSHGVCGEGESDERRSERRKQRCPIGPKECEWES